MPGYDWRDDSGSVVDSSSGYNYNTGTSWGNTNTNTNTNTNNNYYSNPDDGYDDSWESGTGASETVWGYNIHTPEGSDNFYTPPQETYGPGTATPGETAYNYKNIYDDKLVEHLLSGLSPDTLSFFGYDPKNPNRIPVELLQQVMEGEIVGGPEAGNAPGFTYSDFEAAANDPNHKWHNYTNLMKNIMNQPTLLDISESGGDGSGGGGRGWGGWSGSWGGPGGYGSGRGGMYSRRWNPHMKNVNNYNSPIAQVLAQREANKYNNLPKNQWMFTQMLQSMPGGGITEAV